MTWYEAVAIATALSWATTGYLWYRLKGGPRTPFDEQQDEADWNDWRRR